MTAFLLARSAARMPSDLLEGLAAEQAHHATHGTLQMATQAFLHAWRAGDVSMRCWPVADVSALCAQSDYAVHLFLQQTAQVCRCSYSSIQRSGHPEDWCAMISSTHQSLDRGPRLQMRRERLPLLHPQTWMWNATPSQTPQSQVRVSDYRSGWI